MSFGLITSFTLTLLIFSYLLGDNFLYRLAVSVFVGLTAAFTTIAVFRGVIAGLPEWKVLFAGGNGYRDPNVILFIYIPIILVTLLLLKPVPALKSLTNVAVAFLIAVGSAVALVGAVNGTIIPLIADTTVIEGDMLSIVNGIIVLIGVVTSLLYFRHQAKLNPDGTVTQGRIITVLRNIGQGFIVVTLGAIYATAILTSLTILTGQISILLSN
jgi:hypothetical protein